MEYSWSAPWRKKLWLPAFWESTVRRRLGLIIGGEVYVLVWVNALVLVLHCASICASPGEWGGASRGNSLIVSQSDFHPVLFILVPPFYPYFQKHQNCPFLGFGFFPWRACRVNWVSCQTDSWSCRIHLPRLCQDMVRLLPPSKTVVLFSVWVLSSWTELPRWHSKTHLPMQEPRDQARVSCAGLTPGSGRSPGEGNGNPPRYSCLWEIPWTEEPGGLHSMGSQSVRWPGEFHGLYIVHGVAEGQIWLSDFHFTSD